MFIFSVILSLVLMSYHLLIVFAYINGPKGHGHGMLILLFGVKKKKLASCEHCIYALLCVLFSVFLLTVLFCRLVWSYTKLEVDPLKLHWLS